MSRRTVTAIVAGLCWGSMFAEPARAQQNDVHRSFEEVGFAPITTIRQRGDESFRIWINDPYFMLTSPAIEAIREGNTITVSAVYATSDRPHQILWKQAVGSLTVAQWEALKKAEANIRSGASSNDDQTSSSNVICHGWSFSFETGPDRAGRWWGCANRMNDPVFVFADLFLADLITSNPKCVRSGKFSGEFQNFWEFTTCFGPRDELDDPELEAKRAHLVRQWRALYNGDALHAARTLMRQIEREKAPIGGPLWRQAKAATEVVRAETDKLSQLSIEAYRVSESKTALSDADRVKLKGWVRQWNELVQSSEHNYAGLLQNLVDARLP